MNHDQAVLHAAHYILADMIRYGVVKPEREHVGIAIAVEERMKLIVSLVPFDGSPRLYPGVAVESASPVASSVPDLNAIHRAILAAAPGPNAPRVTMKTLIKRARLKYHRTTREAVDYLCEKGLLKRGSRGIMRPES